MASNRAFMPSSRLPTSSPHHAYDRCNGFQGFDSGSSTCDSLPRMIGSQLAGVAMCESFHHNIGTQTWDSLPTITDAHVSSCDSLPRMAGSPAARINSFGIRTSDSLPSATCVGDSLARVLAQYAAPEAPKHPLAAASAASPQITFAGPVRRVRFLSAEGAFEAERFAHEAMLNKIPYFEAMIARWDSGDSGDIRLPAGCSSLAIDALLSRLYSGKVYWTAADWARTLGPGLPAACETLSLAKFLLLDDMAKELVPLLRQRMPDKRSQAWFAASGTAVDVAQFRDELEEDAAQEFVDAIDPLSLIAGMNSVLSSPIDDRSVMARRVLKEIIDQKFGWS